MDDRYFDALTRRIGELTAPSLPRRGLLRLIGAGALAGALGLTVDEDEADARRKRKRRNRNKNNKRCKKPGKRCNKRKCKKKGKRCCCEGKCRGNRCEDKGNGCNITVKRKNVWGGFGGGNGEFRSPWGIDTDEDGHVYVTDTGNDRVQIFNARGSYQDEWGQTGNANETLIEPLGIGVNQQAGGSGSSGRRVFVSDPGKGPDRLLRQFRTDGRWTADMGGEGLSRPYGIAIDDDNNAWVVDRSQGRIYLYDRGGNYITHWTPGGSGSLTSPEGIAVYEDDNNRTYVYVTDAAQNRVHKYHYTGDGENGLSHVKSAGSRGSGRGKFNQPAGLSADVCGNLWVADLRNNRIQILDSDLRFISRFTAGFNQPTDTAISPNGKFLYVVDSNNVRIQRFRLKS